MSKNIQLCFLAFACSLIFSACHSTSKKSADFDVTSKDTLQYSLFSLDTIDANCKYKGCPNITVSYPIFTTPDSALNSYLNAEVIKIILYDSDTSSFATVNNFVKSFFEETATQKADNPSDNSDEYWKSAEFNLERDVSVYDKIGKYISLEVYHGIYEGGAHPNSSVEYKVYDLIQKKQLKAAELLNLNDTALLKIGEKYFKINNGINDTSSLEDAGYFIFGDGEDFEESKNYGKFRFNENFALTKDGVEFQYNAYEIAPYAAGPSSVTIPYNEIQPFLKLKIW